MRIGIKADGGARVGLGHLGRCAALAQAFQALGEEPVFLDVPRECRAWVRAQGFKSAALGRRPWDVLVADSYRFTTRDLRTLRRLAKTLAVVDDSGTFSAPCDWVLNGHLYAHGLAFRADSGAGLLLGPKFLPLRRDYWTPAKKRATPRRLRRVLVVLGGGDAAGWTEKVVAAAEAALPRAEVHAVVGPLAPLPRVSPCSTRAQWHRGPSTLRPLLEGCDAAVTAGGQTLCEAAFTGLPTVAVLMGPDQGPNLESFARAGAVVRAGKPGPGLPGRVGRLLRALDRDAARRRRMSAASSGLFDGRGALRAAALLLGRVA